MTAGLVDRIVRSVRALPSVRDWMECGVAGLALAICLGTLGFQSGMLHVSTRTTSAVVQLAAVAFVAPSLFEELVFRAALIPDRNEQKSALVAVVGSTLLFTAWHLVETTFLPRAGAIFLRADFLVSAALLGLACAVLRRRSGSVWTAVVLHWLVAVVWLGWLAGPTVGELRG
jgi:uncharacterized protein